MRTLLLLALVGCKKPEDSDVIAEATVPEFGFEDEREIVIIASDADDLDVPRDLAFNPEVPEQLWIVNRADDSTVILTNPGTDGQTATYIKDVYANHFMEEVSSIAFGADETFATCQESRNTYDDRATPNDFMGPALWPSDLDIYGQVHQDDNLLGSHLDMLHESPLCMGIAHEIDNVYWVFDGLAGNVVRYDFQEDHGPGYDNHSNGIIHRYPEADVTRVEDVPGHLEFDDGSGLLYVADTGGGRIMVLDTASGSATEDLDYSLEFVAEYKAVTGASWTVFAEGLGEPSGIARVGDRLLVSDHASSEIIAFDLEGNEIERMQTGADQLMGITVGPDGLLYFADADEDTVSVVRP